MCFCCISGVPAHPEGVWLAPGLPAGLHSVQPVLFSLHRMWLRLELWIPLAGGGDRAGVDGWG